MHFRTNRRLPLNTPRAHNRHKIRIRDLHGRLLRSSEPLTRMQGTRDGVPCYEALLDARSPSSLHELEIGDRIQASLELLTEYPKDVGTRIARPRVLTVRPGGDTDLSGRALVALGCYRHLDTDRNGC